MFAIRNGANIPLISQKNKSSDRGNGSMMLTSPASISISSVRFADRKGKKMVRNADWFLGRGMGGAKRGCNINEPPTLTK